MSQDALLVLREALALGDAGRADVASALLASLPGPDQAMATDSGPWLRTIRRRTAESIDGTVELEEWDAAEARILRGLREA